MTDGRIFPELIAYEVIGIRPMNDIPSLIGKKIDDGGKIGVIVDETKELVGVEFPRENKEDGYKVTYYRKEDLIPTQGVQDEDTGGNIDADGGAGCGG